MDYAMVKSPDLPQGGGLLEDSGQQELRGSVLHRMFACGRTLQFAIEIVEFPNKTW